MKCPYSERCKLYDVKDFICHGDFENCCRQYREFKAKERSLDVRDIPLDERLTEQVIDRVRNPEKNKPVGIEGQLIMMEIVR